MAEIYRNSLQYITLDIVGGHADARPLAVCLHPDHPGNLEVVNDPELLPNDIERWTAVLDFAHTQQVGDFQVNWVFGVNDVGAQKLEDISVVVPLVSGPDIRTELELGSDVSWDTIVLAERRVRGIIEAHCDQSFMPTTETIIVRGNGDQFMRLPKRLLSVTDMVDTRMAIPWVGYQITNDGWSIQRTDGYYYDTSTVTAPIYAPPAFGGLPRGWPTWVEWAITGEWGWKTVPNKVREAALVLIEQRLCPQTAYRDNYMSSMKAADWRFDFFQEAVQGTGNVLADQLLAPYVRVGAGVI